MKIDYLSSYSTIHSGLRSSLSMRNPFLHIHTHHQFTHCVCVFCFFAVHIPGSFPQGACFKSKGPNHSKIEQSGGEEGADHFQNTFIAPTFMVLKRGSVVVHLTLTVTGMVCIQR